MSTAEDLGQRMDGGMLPTLPPDATIQDIIERTNEVIVRINLGLKTNVLADNTSRRFLFGLQLGGNEDGSDFFGMKVSMEGVDVTTATDDQLLFKMDMDTWLWSDPENARNFFLIGLKSDGSQGAQLAKPGESL